MTSIPGYMGKILRLDMQRHKASDLVLDDDFLTKYFGGLTMGARLLFDLVPPGCNELGPENKVILTTSPVTGTNAPGVSLVNVTTKSPLFNSASCSQMNGFLGKNMKGAGYDGVIIEGQSDDWQYVTVINGVVEFHDATEILGLDTFSTENFLKEKHGQPKASVFCIGPAGEHLVKFAAVEADDGHFASTGGAGAVMGSKKLKAILFSGDAKPTIADPVAFQEETKAWREEIAADPSTPAYKAYGTISTFTHLYNTCMLPIKNLQTNSFEYAEAYDGANIYSRSGVKFTRTPCFACPIGHCFEMEFTEGQRKGYKADAAEYEGLANFGPNLLVKDPLDSMYLSSINDRMGMDLKECGFTISWALECYEKGYLTKQDTDGLDLTWGNVEAIEILLNRIARREGKFANMLADGIWRASEAVGGEARKWAVYTKRHAPHAHDPRLMIVLNQSVSDMGSFQGGNPMKAEPACGLDQAVNPRDMAAFGWGMGMASKRTMWRDTMLVCMFCENKTSVERLVAVANAVTGIGYSPKEAMTVGHRANQLLRTFNLLAGMTPDDDIASYRLMIDQPDGGSMKGVSQAWFFDIQKQNYYRGMGWDTETSKPLPETLKAVGLEELIPLLWRPWLLSM